MHWRIAKPGESISLAEINALIAEHPALQPVPDRTMVNPFTKEPILARGEGKAYYLDGGKPVGNLALEEGEVITTGIPRAACERFAALLGAELSEADFS